MSLPAMKRLRPGVTATVRPDILQPGTTVLPGTEAAGHGAGGSAVEEAAGSADEELSATVLPRTPRGPPPGTPTGPAPESPPKIPMGLAPGSPPMTLIGPTLCGPCPAATVLQPGRPPMTPTGPQPGGSPMTPRGPPPASLPLIAEDSPPGFAAEPASPTSSSPPSTVRKPGNSPDSTTTLRWRRSDSTESAVPSDAWETSAYCEVCKVHLNGLAQYADHLRGRMHKRKLKGGQSSIPSTAAPSEADVELGRRARMLEVTPQAEIQAARLIQRAWRKRRGRS